MGFEGFHRCRNLHGMLVFAYFAVLLLIDAREQQTNLTAKYAKRVRKDRKGWGAPFLVRFAGCGAFHGANFG